MSVCNTYLFVYTVFNYVRIMFSILGSYHVRPCLMISGLLVFSVLWYCHLVLFCVLGTLLKAVKACPCDRSS